MITNMAPLPLSRRKIIGGIWGSKDGEPYTRIVYEGEEELLEDKASDNTPTKDS